MKFRSGLVIAFSLMLAGPIPGQNASVGEQNSRGAHEKKTKNKKSRSAKGEIGSGAGNIAGGAGKGVGHAAEGVGKGGVDLVTLHPVGAATNVAKGGVQGGKDVAVGATKGTAKITKGIGKGLKHIF